MKKTEFNDGICDNCGNVGLAGEKCLNCGSIFSKVDENLVDTVVHHDELSVDGFAAAKKPDIYPLEVLEKEEESDEAV